MDQIVNRCFLPVTFLPSLLRWLGWLPFVLVLTLVLHFVSRGVSAGRLSGSRHLMTIVVGFVLLASWAPAILVFQGARIAGETYWWLHDDAMISMRYGRYYRDALPNTACLKVTGWSGRVEAGLRYVAAFLGTYLLPLVLAMIGAVGLRRRALSGLGGIVLVHVAYVAYVGGDVFGHFRFFVPLLPVLLAMAFVSLERLRLRPVVAWAVGAICLVSTPLVVPAYREVLGYFSFFRGGDIGNIEMALLIKENSPDTSKVAATAAGSIFYFSRRPGVDLLGKNDRYVAKLSAFAGSQKQGHNKFDYDYSLGVLKPDFAIAAEFRPNVTEDTMKTRLSGEHAYSGQFYFNPVFRTHFFPNPVKADTWRTIYVADWSDQWKNRGHWRPLNASDRASGEAAPTRASVSARVSAWRPGRLARVRGRGGSPDSDSTILACLSPVCENGVSTERAREAR